MTGSIPLSQKLYLLGIHPEKGGIVSASYTAMDYIIIGSVLIELFQNKNIKFDKKKVIVLNNKAENDLHQFVLDKMERSSRSLNISRWISKFHISRKYIRNEIQQGLVEKRIIRMEPRRFLFFSWKKPILVNKQVVYSMVNGIEKQVFGGTITEDEIILLSFLKPAGLLKRIFPDRHKRKQAKQRLKKIMVENQVSIAVADAISAAQAVAASVGIIAGSAATVN